MQEYDDDPWDRVLGRAGGGEDDPWDSVLGAPPTTSSPGTPAEPKREPGRFGTFFRELLDPGGMAERGGAERESLMPHGDFASSPIGVGLREGTRGTLPKIAGGALEAGGELLGRPGMADTGREWQASAGRRLEALRPEAEALEGIPGAGAARTIAQGVTSMAPMIGAGVLGATVGPWAGVLGTLAAGYGFGLGDIQTELTEQGMDPGDAAKRAAIGAVPYAALERIVPGRAAGGLIGRMTGPGVLKETLRGAATEGITEGAQSALSQGLGEEGVRGIDVGQVAAEAKAGALTGGFVGSAASALSPGAAPAVQEKEDGGVEGLKDRVEGIAERASLDMQAAQQMATAAETVAPEPATDADPNAPVDPILRQMADELIEEYDVGDLVDQITDPKSGFGRSVLQEYLDRGGKIGGDPDLPMSTLLRMLGVAQTDPSKVGQTSPNDPQETPEWSRRQVEPRTTGTRQRTLFPGTDERVETEYAVMEANELRASHTPGYSQRPEGEFPTEIQGRAYHGDRGRQAREHTEGIVAGFDSDRVLDATASAAEGPPVVTSSGVAVAGNGRIIVMQRLPGEKSAAYRARLEELAGDYGIDPTQLEGMDRPVLVRRITDESVDVTDVETLRRLNQASDVPAGKTKDLLSDAASRAEAMRSADSALEHFAEGVEGDQTIRQYLGTASGQEFLKKLVADGVIAPSERARFLDATTGTPTSEGKSLVERMMLVAALGDADAVGRAPGDLVRKIETALPAVIQADRTEGWAIGETLREAFDIVAEARAKDHSVQELVTQGSLLEGAYRQEAVQMADFLVSATPTTVRSALRAYAEDAAAFRRQSQSDDLFGHEPTGPEDARSERFVALAPMGTPSPASESASRHFVAKLDLPEESSRVVREGLGREPNVAEAEALGVAYDFIAKSREKGNRGGLTDEQLQEGEKAPIRTPLDIPEIRAARILLEAAPRDTHLIDTPRRTKLREDIAERLYNEKGEERERGREAWIVMGPPGAGKSTAIVRQLKEERGVLEIDSDIVKEHLPEFGGGINAGGVHLESSDIADAILDRALDNGDNVVLPRIGKGLGSMRKLIANLKKAGYTVHLSLVDLDPMKAAGRAVTRYLENGRFVDVEFVLDQVGRKPEGVYEALKGDPRVATFKRVDSDVPYGAPPIVLEEGSNDEAGKGSALLPSRLAVPRHGQDDGGPHGRDVRAEVGAAGAGSQGAGPEGTSREGIERVRQIQRGEIHPLAPFENKNPPPDIVARFTNEEDGTEARVIRRQDGRFSVSLWDTDAGESLGESWIYPTQERAEAKAREVEGPPDSGGDLFGTTAPARYEQTDGLKGVGLRDRIVKAEDVRVTEKAPGNWQVSLPSGEVLGGVSADGQQEALGLAAELYAGSVRGSRPGGVSEAYENARAIVSSLEGKVQRGAASPAEERRFEEARSAIRALEGRGLDEKEVVSRMEEPGEPDPYTGDLFGLAPTAQVAEKLRGAGKFSMEGGGTDAPSPSKIIGELQKVLAKALQGLKVDEGGLNPKLRKAGALGQADVRAGVIRLGGATDVQVFGHEAGHLMQRLLFGSSGKAGISDAQLEALPGAIRGELEDLGKGISDESLKEGWAEFWRLYVDNVEGLEGVADNVLQEVEQRLEAFPGVKEAWKKARADWRLHRDASPQARVRSKISVKEDPRAFSIEDEWSRFRTNIIDDLEPIRKVMAVLEERGVGPDGIAENMERLARLTRGSTGLAEQFLGSKPGLVSKAVRKISGETERWIGGAMDFRTGRKVGKSFGEILEPVQKTIDDFRDYVVSRRALELHDRDVLTGIRKEDAQWVVDKLEERFGDTFKPAFDEIQKWNGQLLRYLRDAGVISTEALQAIEEKNLSYVPFYRVREGSLGGGTLGAGFGHLFSPIKKIKGSGRDLIDPLESLVKNAFSYVHLAQKQQVSNALARLAEKEGVGDIFEKLLVPIKPTQFQLGEIESRLEEVLPGAKQLAEQMREAGRPDPSEELLAVFRPGDLFGKANVISVLRGDKRQWYEVDPELYKALEGLDREHLDAWARMLATPARLLRAGATLAPEFQIRNPARDQVMAFIQSEYGYVPIWDLARGAFEVVRKGEAYQQWRSSGGERASLLSLDRKTMQNNVRELVKSGGVPNVIKDPLDMLRALSGTIEDATRMGEFLRARSKLGTSKEALQTAAAAAREVSIDFSRHGAKTTALRSLAAFWNARIQGYDRLARAAKNDPVGFSAKTFAAVTLPSLLEYYANRDDERYWEIPQWQRDLFWIFKVGETYVRIPKPFELGLVFGTLPVRVLETFAGTNGGSEELRSFFEDTLMREAESMAPMPTFMQPLIENQVNYSFFLRRPIDPRSDEELMPRYRHGVGTSEVAKLLGRWAPGDGISPRKIDNLLHSWTGGLGRIATETADVALRGFTDEPSPPSPTAADIPGVRGLVVREPGFSSESVERFYKRYMEARMADRTARELEDREDWDELDRLMADDDFRKSRDELTSLRRVGDELSTLRSEAERIRRDPRLERDSKRDRIQKLGEEAMEITRAALGREE